MLYRPQHKDIIMPASWESMGILAGTTAPASATFPAANRAIFIPFRIHTPYTVRKLVCINGTVVSGNVDMGIYTYDGRLMISIGTTVHANTSAKQEFDIADTRLGVDLFYMALGCSNTTATFYRKTPQIENLRSYGAFQMASAFPLPVTVTFAAITTAYVPQIGVSRGDVI